MLPLYTQVLFWSIPTFRLAVALSILASMGLALRQQRLRGRAMDVYLGGLLGALLVARLFHVGLNWDYFADNMAEIGQLEAGGLDWHGALLGGFVGMALVLWGQRIVRRWRPPALKPMAFNTLLISLIPALPLIGFGGWVGCWAAGCGYGKEVDSLANYPCWATSELVDVFGIVAPRYNTPYFGMALCIVGLLLVVASWRWRSPRWFWLLLVVLSIGMFAIGFFRADHTLMVDGLRGDQLLDMIFVLWGMIMMFLTPGQRGIPDEQAS